MADRWIHYISPSNSSFHLLPVSDKIARGANIWNESESVSPRIQLYPQFHAWFSFNDARSGG